MKKILFRVLLIIIFIISLLGVNSYARENVEAKFEEGIEVDAGEYVLIPLYVYNIETNVAQQEILWLKTEINYDENAFDAEDSEFTVDDAFLVKNTDGAIEKAYLRSTYNVESKILVISIEPSYTEDLSGKLSEFNKLGTLKLKVKDGIKTGDYMVATTKVSAGNDDVSSISGYGNKTNIHVKGVEEETEENNVTVEKEKNTEIIEKEGFKKAKLSIEINGDKTEVTITPDEVNGAEIGKIEINGQEIEKNSDNKYVFEIEKDVLYYVKAYNKEGAIIYNDYIMVNDDSDDTEKDDGEKSENKEDSKDDSIDNSPKTGDYIAIVGSLICISGVACVFATKLSRRKQ